MLDDLRFSLRSLRKTPGFTVVAVATLGLGIALNVAVFAAVNALLFKPLGGPAEGELVGVYDRERVHPANYRSFTYPDYRVIRDHPGALAGVLAHEPATVGITDGGVSSRVFATLVSGNYFSTLAVRPALGRDFRPEEEDAGTPVAIVSDRYWRQHGADPGMPGRMVRINGRDFTIVGVAPAGFSGATALVSPDLWLPLGACAILAGGAVDQPDAGCLHDESRHALALVGRLPSGVSQAAASASLAGLARELSSARAAGDREIVVGGLSRLSIGAGPSGDNEVALVMVFLSALALSVLLTASLNLANMLLARGTTRGREMAVRFALGGTRWHVVRLLFAESGAIALAAGLLGLALATACTHLLAVGVAGALPFAVVFDATPDVRVLGAALAFALVAGLGCAIGPALGLARRATLSQLKDAGVAGAGRMSVRNALVVVQLATSLALLTAAGLFVRGALAAGRADGGYRLDGAIVVTLAPELAGYAEARGREAYDGALARLRARADVAAASLSSDLPFGLDAEGGMVRDAAGGEKSPATATMLSSVGSDYFRTLGLSLLRGREFDRAEERGPSGAKPVIVDQTLAARLWPGGDPLGQRLQSDDGKGGWNAAMEVVGVVPGVKHGLFDAEPMPHVYVPSGSRYHGQLQLHLRMRSGQRAAEATMLRSIRELLAEVDPTLAVLGVDTMRGLRDRSFHLWFARAAAALFTTFGIAALVLAVLGVYGVKSYLVARRAREIAVRMALGATRRTVLRLVLGDGLVLTACGLSAGIVLSVALSRLLASWLPGTGGLALVPVASAAAVLGASALFACWAPVRRATARAPWTVLRAE